MDPSGCVYIYSEYKNWRLPNDDEFFLIPDSKITKKDMTNWKVWGKVSKSVKKMYPDGVRFYNHFRGNTGKTLYYDYKKVYNADKKIKNLVDSLIKAVKDSVNKFYKHLKDKYFYLSTEMVDIRPNNMNWQLAIGSHKVGVRAKLYYNSKKMKYTMNYEVVAYDRYNFDRTTETGATKKFLGIPDSYNGRFVELGLAKFYYSIGTMKGKIEWVKLREI